MREQRVEPGGRHGAGRADEQPVAGNHQPRNIVADLDRRGERGILTAVRGNQRAGGSGYHRRADSLGSCDPPRQGGKEAAGVVEQPSRYGSIQEKAGGAEGRRVAGRQHGQLGVDLVPFFGEQPLQQRIFQPGEVKPVKPALGRVWVDGQRPVSQVWRFLLTVRNEPLQRLAGVDRRDRKQEIKAAGNSRELPVRIEGRLEECAAPERSVMDGRVGLAIVEIGAGRLQQRVSAGDGQFVGQLRIDAAVSPAMHLRKADQHQIVQRRPIAQAAHQPVFTRHLPLDQFGPA
jgi:hypothetical protein